MASSISEAIRHVPAANSKWQQVRLRCFLASIWFSSWGQLWIMHRQSYTTFFSLEFTSQNRSWCGDIFPDTKCWVSLDICVHSSTHDTFTSFHKTDRHPSPSSCCCRLHGFPHLGLGVVVVVRKRTRETRKSSFHSCRAYVCVSLNSLTKFQAGRDTRYLSNGGVTLRELLEISPPAFLWRGMSSARLFFPFFFQNGQRSFHFRLPVVPRMTGDLQISCML